MRWRLKALAQQVFSLVPGGAALNAMAQTHLTRGLQVDDELVARMRAAAERHWSAVSTALGDREVAQLRGYEFGAGWHLGVAVVLASKSVGRQTLVDRHPLARPDLVAATIAAICSTDLADSRLIEAARCDGTDAALEALGIEYLAPRDARATGLPGDSVDFVTSTSVLEHVPAQDLDALLAECHRLLRPGGVLSALIDYGDHYAHRDPSITSVNFLVYGPRHWRLYSPSLHHQNRLRHSDHLAKLAGVGFEILSVEVVRGSDADRALVASGRLHASYRGREPEDLTIREAHIVARKVGVS